MVGIVHVVAKSTNRLRLRSNDFHSGLPRPASVDGGSSFFFLFLEFSLGQRWPGNGITGDTVCDVIGNLIPAVAHTCWSLRLAIRGATVLIR